MNLYGLFLLAYLIFAAFLIYAMICGNNKVHRNGFVGKVYQFMTNGLPKCFTRCGKKLCPSKFKNGDDEGSCIGEGGPCHYFVFIFFLIIYIALGSIYWIYVYPNLKHLFPQNLNLHQFLSFFLLPIPWIIVIALQFIDPGIITKYNVLNYLKKYPYDHQLYFERMCPTDHIPIVPRSRYCKYTHHRIAMYDHYCPWVLAPIGERTHRFFLAFLISCTNVSAYYAYGCLKRIIFRMLLISSKVKWTQSKANNIALGFLILVRAEPLTFSASILLIVIVIALLIFIGQQLYYVSKNITQIELDKYDTLKDKMKESGSDQKIINYYNKGIVENWKEFLFPSKVENGEVFQENQKTENQKTENKKGKGKVKKH